MLRVEKVIFSIILVLLMVACADSSEPEQAQQEQPDQQAIAQQLLQQATQLSVNNLQAIDAGQFQPVYDAGSAVFKQNNQLDIWNRVLTQKAQAYGRVVGRTLVDSRLTDNIQGIGQGTFAATVVDTEFENATARELMIMMIENSAWKLASYNITNIQPKQSAAQPAASQQQPAAASQQQAAAQTTEQQNAVRLQIQQLAFQTTNSFFANLDQGNFADAYVMTSDFYKGTIKRRPFVNQVRELRKRAGSIQQRQVRNLQIVSNVPNFPEGNYVIQSFTSTYENGQIAETVVLRIISAQQFEIYNYITGAADQQAGSL